MRKTKIVCTMGPACDNKQTLLKMINAGMNVARINMSHGSYEEQKQRIGRLKEAIAESGKNIAILLDTKGPEIRVGTFEKGQVDLKKGQEFSLYKEPTPGTEQGINITFPKLVDLFKNDSSSKGRTLLFNDGKIAMTVKEVTNDAIVCTVKNGGVLSNKKSINIPDYVINMPYVSAADRADIEFGLSQGADAVAASFVRSAEDIKTLKDYIESIGYDNVDIIAKIENQAGVDDIDRIIAVCDGIMVARGDMGVEIPFIKLPEIQKRLIKKCVEQGKYVITATQMLESMTTSPIPTRAEISDVANAVYDGTSAVMLSGESAAGQYPVESIKALDGICTEAEKNNDFMTLKTAALQYELGTDFREVICRSARYVAENVGAKAIIVESLTGRVAKAMAHYRPKSPIIAVVTSGVVSRKLCFVWGITAVIGEEKQTSDEITQQAVEQALSTNIVKKGDTVVIISSNKTDPTSGTDTLNIRVV